MSPKKAVVPEAYQAFILKALDANGGYMKEEALDALIEEKFRPLWSATDLAPWGNQPHPKWKQNLASAKSGLDRRGIVVRYVAKKIVYRVKLPPAIFCSAFSQWSTRPAQRPKRRYEELPQPQRVYVVPDLD